MSGLVKIKFPAEELDYTVDWSAELGAEDTINTSDWPDQPAGITVGTGPKAPSKTDTTTTIWLSGGTAGTEYVFKNVVVTLGGRTYEKEVAVRVRTTPAALPSFDGCVWPIDPACLTDEWDSYEDVVRQRSVTLASAALTRLTGGRVGDCPIRVRPDVQRGSCGLLATPAALSLGLPGYWNAGLYFTPLPLWSAGDPRDLDLPAPAYSVSEVNVDGTILPTADYQLHSVKGAPVLRYTGTDLDGWPVTQDWDAGDADDGWFSVTYLNTAPVDSQGAHAAGLLALEFAKACSGDKSCKLPKNTATVVRTGISIEILTGVFPDGQTGVREVDAYTSLWTRNGRAPASLFDPGAPAHRVVIG